MQGNSATLEEKRTLESAIQKADRLLASAREVREAAQVTLGHLDGPETGAEGVGIDQPAAPGAVNQLHDLLDGIGAGIARTTDLLYRAHHVLGITPPSNPGSKVRELRG